MGFNQASVFVLGHIRFMDRSCSYRVTLLIDKRLHLLPSSWGVSTSQGDKTGAYSYMVGLPAHCICLLLPWCQMVQLKLVCLLKWNYPNVNRGTYMHVRFGDL